MRKIALAAAAAFAVVSTAAVASVTFDPSTGTGFVGKGDVQLVFGWNNAAAQSRSTSVTFKYQASTTYDVTIDFDTGNPLHNVTHHSVTQNTSTAVTSAIASEARKTGQYTGWNLTGLGATTTSGDPVPNVGDSCPNGNLGTCQVTAVTPISSVGGLYVTYGGNSVLLLPAV
jgi:hypothetical protein